MSGVYGWLVHWTFRDEAKFDDGAGIDTLSSFYDGLSNYSLAVGKGLKYKSIFLRLFIDIISLLNKPKKLTNSNSLLDEIYFSIHYNNF